MPDLEMARIAGGSLELHDPRQRTRRTVELEPFEIGVFPVTEEQLAELIGQESRHPRRPAVGVSWLRAVRFCNAASEWEGLDPVYGFEGEDVTWHLDADGFRLPTEFEWEIAAQGLAPDGERATAAALRPLPAGPPSGGLRQMYGHVWQWTQSAYLPYPGYRPPAGALGEYNGKFMVSQQVLRGASCATAPGHTRPTYRNFFYPHQRWQFVGLRLASDMV